MLKNSTSVLRLEKDFLSADYKMILETVQSAVIAVSVSRTTSFANSAAHRLLQRSKDDLYGHNLDSLLNLIDVKSNAFVPNPVNECLRLRETVCLYDVDLVARDGQHVPVECTANPMQDKRGNLSGAVLVINDVSHTRELQQDLTFQAMHDELTGLLNRRAFEMKLAYFSDDADLNRTGHAMLYIDLDQFKVVNDTAGHLAGDQLLVAVTQEIKQILRTGDLLARLGGDEFGILLPSCPMTDAMGVAEKIRACIEDFTFIWQERPYQIGTSIGVAIIDEYSAKLNLLGFADMACYAAKNGGRNQVHLYSHDDKDLIAHREQMGLQSRIKAALKEERFILYSQDIVPIDVQGEPDRFTEILVRMVDEEGGLVAPDLFIPAAERFGLMPQIDRFVIDRTIELLESCDKINVTINLSGTSLSSPDFTEYVLGRFNTYRDMASRICFEVTETAAISHLQDSVKFFHSLKQIGFTLALDDFGSGLSSFGYLRTLPVDIVKIDGAFIKNMVDSSVDRAMVEAIVNVSREMGLRTIAEFVENQETLDLLAIYGVDFAQGYYLHKPGEFRKLQ